MLTSYYYSPLDKQTLHVRPLHVLFARGIMKLTVSRFNHMSKNLLLIGGILLGITTKTLSQHLQGIAMGNYSGTQALYHNPAFVADSRYSVYVNFVGSQLYTANSGVRYNAPYSFLGLITNQVSDQYRSPKGAVLFPRAYLKERLNGRDKWLNAGGDTRLPSIMFGLFKNKIGVGLSTRVRYYVNGSGITEPLARLLSKTTREPDLQGQHFDNQSGKLNANAMAELAMTVGGVVIDNETDFLKVGITIKRLIGLYNANAEVKNSSYSIQPDPAWANRRHLIVGDQINVKYGITKDEAFQDFRPNVSWLLGNNAAGNGWGIDLGAVYEYRPDINKYSYTEKGVRMHDASKNKYLYRVAVSLTDLGRVHFNNPTYLLQQEVNTAGRILRYDDFQKLQGSEGAFDAVNKAFGVSGSQTADFHSVLPMAFQASVDYNIQPKIYVNALWVQNLVPQSTMGMKAESMLSVTPRYEHKWYEISVPVSIMNRYSSPAIGLAMRAGPVWLGTDHITGLLNIGNPKSFNLYFGISAGLFRRPPEMANKCWPAEKSWLRRIFSRRDSF